MLRARMPARPHLREMFRLEEGLDFPVEVVDVVGGTKAAFNAGFPSVDYSLASSWKGLNDTIIRFLRDNVSPGRTNQIAAIQVSNSFGRSGFALSQKNLFAGLVDNYWYRGIVFRQWHLTTSP